MTYALFIALIGMGGVFLFLGVLMYALKLESFLITLLTKDSSSKGKVAAIVAIALNKKRI